jgi:hypothetical protein
VGGTRDHPPPLLCTTGPTDQADAAARGEARAGWATNQVLVVHGACGRQRVASARATVSGPHIALLTRPIESVKSRRTRDRSSRPAASRRAIALATPGWPDPPAAARALDDESSHALLLELAVRFVRQRQSPQRRERRARDWFRERAALSGRGCRAPAAPQKRSSGFAAGRLSLRAGRLLAGCKHARPRAVARVGKRPSAASRLSRTRSSRKGRSVGRDRGVALKGPATLPDIREPAPALS